MVAKKIKFKIIDRYLFSELLGPFWLGVVGFIMVMITDLLFTFTDLIINKGVPFVDVLKLLIFKLPSIMVLTFPVATLFATAMALGRLSKDNEVVALRTSGVSLFRIAAPIIILSMFVSLMSYFTNEKLVPYANHVSDQIIRKILYKKPVIEVKENVFFKDAQNRYYYIHKADPVKNLLEDVMIYELADENFPRVITAPSANFSNMIWQLQNGLIHEYDREGHLIYEGRFDEMAIFCEQDFMNYAQEKTTDEMNSRELNAMISSLNKGGVNTRSLIVDLYMKFSIPLTCFVFALVAVPLSLPTIRSGRTWGVVLSIVIVFTFYVFASVFRSLGRGGVLLPFLAAFGPQLLFGSLGAILLFLEGSRK